MKSQLNEVQRLQKIAGILKENINEAPLTINQVVKQLNKIANSKGFYAVDKSADVRIASHGRYNLVKWEDEDENTVELYSDIKGPEATFSDLGIEYRLKNGKRAVQSVSPWLDPNNWDSYLEHLGKKNEDPLYNELASEIGEKKLQKLLMKGWEIDDIATNPQAAAASIK